MPSSATPPGTDESPTIIRERAASLAEYLLAVRAKIEKPVREVPAVAAFWQTSFPSHSACQVGPEADGTSWLRVGLPPAPQPIKVPRDIAPHLANNVSHAVEPRLIDDAEEAIRWRFERWRDDEWSPWAAQAKVIISVRDLHRQLFDLKHQMDMNAAQNELVWGHGIVEMRIDGHRVRYPLVVTAVAIEYDPDSSLVTVSAQGPGRLQTEPLSGLEERYLTQLLALAGPGGLVDADVWDELERRELFDRALRRIGHDPLIRDAGAADPGVPHIHDTGVLFSRPRQRMLRRFLEELRKRLLAGDTGSIGALAAILAHEPSKLRMPDDQPERWAPVGERLLMPLPTNEAQESIARRLAQHRNVSVQGPPGTGKTHTIRNLISHLMAHGKRVLVVAQKEDPLRVLRDGLPEEIQSLCLAVLGRSSDQLIQLQLAARELSDRGATLDKKTETARVERLVRQLEEAERELAQALGGLRTIAENESASYEIDGIALSPADVGAWLRQRADAYGDIPDAVSLGVAAPLTTDDFTILLEVARRIDPQDRAQALRHLPVTAEFPAAAQARADRVNLAEATAEIDQLAVAGVDIAGVRAFGQQALNELLTDLREALALLDRREGGWNDRLGQLLVDPHWQYTWDHHVAGCQHALAQLAEVARIVAGHHVVVAEGYQAEPRRLLAQLAELRQRLAAGKSVNKLFHGALHRLVSDCRIDGEALRTAEDVDIVVAHINRSRLRQELGARWAEWAQRLGIPLPEQSAEPEMWAGRLLAEALNSIEWDRQRWPALRSRIQPLVHRVEATIDARRLADLVTLLAHSKTVFDHDRAIDAERAVSAALQRGMSEQDASELWRLLDMSWQDPDLPKWDETLAEARRLAALRPDAQQYAQLHALLGAAAPGWAAAIDAGTASALNGSGADCLQRWSWRQAQTWFDTVVGSVDPAALSRRVEQSRDGIRRLTRELVVASAWLEVSKSLDDRRRAALADWTAALRKIGKGTGKNAAMWQAHAQKAMAAAVDAVPVWVMSIDRAIEQFAGGAHFDVVIVDEASQADMFALPVLTLADRAVVVGDDQQIGPQLSFVGTVAGLINAHLAEVPSAEHFDPEGSLYDHAVRRSPERILLTEHFRCVPAIIEFSSKHYYEGKIEPLRTDKPQGIGDAVVAVHVPDGVRQTLPAFGEVNVAEAEALVERVAAIVADPAYAGKTIGVVSLLSTSGQALYLLERIRETIGAEEMERRRLRVGDSYTFQGDERDVVLISLVASANDGRLAAFTKRDYHRRVNVAASRARDQLWVFHSLQPADLRADDARAWLLTYCQNVNAADEAYDDLEKRCDSDFEREVLRRLLLRCHRPLPQFRIGSYRIDFVLPAPDGRRLAIECDGDAYHGPDQWESDSRRQAILERVGNCVFVRIRGSVFSRDPDAALQPLWQRIEELRIGLPEAAPSEWKRAEHELRAPQPQEPPVLEVGLPEAEPAGEEPAAWDFDQGSAAQPVTAGGQPDGPPTEAEGLASTADGAEIALPVGADKATTVGPDGSDSTVDKPANTVSGPAEPTTTASRNLSAAPAKQQARPVVTPTPSEADDSGVPVPAGYRNAAWIRPHEAAAALDSYKHCKDVPVRHEGKVAGWARYYDSASPEARKYRANVLVQRVHPNGARLVCWLRPHEAKAVLRAVNLKRDMPIEDGRGRHVGMVQYFPEASPAALRYRSVTRLLRTSAASVGDSTPAKQAGKPPSATAKLTRPAGATGLRTSEKGASQPAQVPPQRSDSSPSPTRDASPWLTPDGGLIVPPRPSVDASNLHDLETRFHWAMVRVYERARDDAGYNATIFLKMITDQGGLSTAQQLLRSPVVSDGFTALWERGRADLTVEAVVLSPEYRALFTKDELSIARSRMKDVSVSKESGVNRNLGREAAADQEL